MLAEMDFKTLAGYRMLLRENARGLWSGVVDWFQFYSSMQLSINRGFNQAWEEGMKVFGMTMEDMTPDERTKLNIEINHEYQYIEGVADFIEANSRANGGKLSSCLQRIEQWVAAYTRVKQLATAMAAKDKPLKWTMNELAEHCHSCIKLNGKVKRGSYWQRHVTPKQWDKLECKKGCKCDLLPTDEKLSRGRLPNLP